MKQEQSGTQNTFMNAEESQPKEASTLVLREKIEGTPFYIVVLEDVWFLAFGPYKVTEEFKKEELEPTDLNARSILEEEKWNITMRLTGIIAEAVFNSNSTINETEQ